MLAPAPVVPAQNNNKPHSVAIGSCQPTYHLRKTWNTAWQLVVRLIWMRYSQHWPNLSKSILQFSKFFRVSLVLFSVFSVVNGITEIKKTSKWEKYIESSCHWVITTASMDAKVSTNPNAPWSLTARNFIALNICKNTASKKQNSSACSSVFSYPGVIMPSSPLCFSPNLSLPKHCVDNKEWSPSFRFHETWKAVTKYTLSFFFFFFFFKIINLDWDVFLQFHLVEIWGVLFILPSWFCLVCKLWTLFIVFVFSWWACVAKMSSISCHSSQNVINFLAEKIFLYVQEENNF